MSVGFPNLYKYIVPTGLCGDLNRCFYKYIVPTGLHGDLNRCFYKHIVLEERAAYPNTGTNTIFINYSTITSC